MSSSAIGSAGLADRYAGALFDLAEDEKALDDVSSDLLSIRDLLDQSTDFVRLIRSPVISRGDQQKAMSAVLTAAGVSPLTNKFIGVVTGNRRLFALPEMIRAFDRILASRRGETTAEVVSAKPLTKAQTTAIANALKASVGMDVALATRVDPGLLGGLIVRIGSRMIDSSLKSKLNRLSLVMKGVG